MSSLPTTEPRREVPIALVLMGFVAVSLAVHAGGLWVLDGRHADWKPPQKPIEVEIIDLPPPPPPPPPPEEPKPPPEAPKPKPPPIKTAEKVKPPEELPPPPNEPPPPEAPKAPVMIGLVGSSTSTAGSFAAPVGNSLYGKTDKTAADPSTVKAYAAPKYAPPGTTDTDPERIGEDCRDAYPEEARKADVEGTVVLRLMIDEQGNVADVRVLSGPGYGLNEAAAKAIRRCRFKPATRDGQPVGTSLTYKYHFWLD